MNTRIAGSKQLGIKLCTFLFAFFLLGNYNLHPSDSHKAHKDPNRCSLQESARTRHTTTSGPSAADQSHVSGLEVS
ncbi:hypothetical protein PIIN_11235 [Serendipita indica DSM 11827]|uniref:Uncharacterized protein n=1 Tax=Serendipita indica (strain DSM 11827) TaxID=1109443 RepID=G4U113_SERID|nr:hypothetical protein PIIN_11235 [Serendipita indica DSM 11827]